MKPASLWVPCGVYCYYGGRSAYMGVMVMLAFIDVAGDPFSSPEKSLWIVAHAVTFRTRALNEIHRRLHQAKVKYLEKEDKEVKSTSLINRSTLENQGTDKFRFLDDVVSLCLDDCDCYHSAIVFANNGQNKKSAENYLPKHYRDLLWRVEAIVEKFHEDDTLVVIDNNARRIDKQIAHAFNSYLFRSYGGRELRKILPVPIFADSEMTAGLQLADIAAGIVRKYHDEQLHMREPNAEESQYHAKLREYFQIVRNRSVQHRVGQNSIDTLTLMENYNI